MKTSLLLLLYSCVAVGAVTLRGAVNSTLTFQEGSIEVPANNQTVQESENGEFEGINRIEPVEPNEWKKGAPIEESKSDNPLVKASSSLLNNVTESPSGYEVEESQGVTNNLIGRNDGHDFFSPRDLPNSWDEESSFANNKERMPFDDETTNEPLPMDGHDGSVTTHSTVPFDEDPNFAPTESLPKEDEFNYATTERNLPIEDEPKEIRPISEEFNYFTTESWFNGEEFDSVTTSSPETDEEYNSFTTESSPETDEEYNSVTTSSPDNTDFNTTGDNFPINKGFFNNATTDINNDNMTNDENATIFSTSSPQDTNQDNRGDLPKTATDNANATNTNATRKEVVTCPLFHIPCRDGASCVSFDLFCDLHPNCPDGSDEDASYCQEGVAVVVCDDGQMVRGHDVRCNGVKDCRDGSDEMECQQPAWPTWDHQGHSNGTHQAPTADDNLDKLKVFLKPCNWQYQFQCSEGTCVDKARVCDGVADCPFGVDETASQCALKKFSNDGGDYGDNDWDGDGADTVNDNVVGDNGNSAWGQYKIHVCADRQVVLSTVNIKCNEKQECSDGSDESDCGRFSYPDSSDEDEDEDYYGNDDKSHSKFVIIMTLMCLAQFIFFVIVVAQCIVNNSLKKRLASRQQKRFFVLRRKSNTPTRPPSYSQVFGSTANVNGETTMAHFDHSDTAPIVDNQA